MVSRLLDISLRQRVLIIICALMIGAGGVYAFRTIPIDAFPDVTQRAGAGRDQGARPLAGRSRALGDLSDRAASSRGRRPSRK